MSTYACGAWVWGGGGGGTMEIVSTCVCASFVYIL